jgi:hypothetical protein
MFPGQPSSASSQSEIGVFLTFFCKEGLHPMEIANLNQVNGDLARHRGSGVAGLVRTFWERWKQIARKIGDFQARALMTVFYFLILGPVALVLRWRSDPLAIKATTPRGWNIIERMEGAPMEHSRRQF